MSDKEISELNLKSAEHYGLQLQMNHFTEELAELIQAVAECDPKHVAEEMADVEVMVEQMEYLLTLDKDVIKRYTNMDFFNSAIEVLQTLVVALGAGLGVWGAINLLEGYGNDNPGAKSQGMKQLMAGGGVALIGITLIPLLSGLFG